MVEAELLAALSSHDALVGRCARGELAWEEFERSYNAFYPRYALDGHEADRDEKALLAKYAGRIVLHRRLWDEVLTRITLEEQVGVYSDFIGVEEATRRLRAHARTHGL